MTEEETDLPSNAQLLSENLEEEFQFYVRFAKPLAIKIRNYSDRINASKWVTRLENESDPKLKNDYLKLLLFAMQRPRLIVPFDSPPNDEPLKTIEGSQLTDQAAILWEETLYKEQASGDFGPPCLVETSADDKQYVAYQEIPNFGLHCFLALSNSEPIRKWITPNYPPAPGSQSKQPKSQSTPLIASNDSHEGGTKLPRWIERMTRTLKDEIELVLQPATPGSKSPPRTPTRQRQSSSPRRAYPVNLIEFSPDQVINNVRQPSFAPPCNDDFEGADDFDFGGDMGFQSADQFIEREGNDPLPFDQTVTLAPDLMGEVDWQNFEQFRCRTPSDYHQMSPKTKSPLRDQEGGLSNRNDFIPGSRGICIGGQGGKYSKSPTKQRQNIPSPPLVDEWSNFTPGRTSFGVCRKLNFDESASMPINNEGDQNMFPTNIQNDPGTWEESNFGGANFEMAEPRGSRNRCSSPLKSPGGFQNAPGIWEDSNVFETTFDMNISGPCRNRNSSPPESNPCGVNYDMAIPGPSRNCKTSPLKSPRARSRSPCPNSPQRPRSKSPPRQSPDAWDTFQPGLAEFQKTPLFQPGLSEFQRTPCSPRQIPTASPHKLNFDDWNDFTPSLPVSPRKEISPTSPCSFGSPGEEDFQFQDAAAIIEQEKEEEEQKWPFEEGEVEIAQDLLEEFNIEEHSEQFSPPSPCNIRQISSRTRITTSLDPHGLLRDAQGNIVSEVTSRMRDPDGTEITLRRSLRREMDENGVCNPPAREGKKVPRRLTYGDSRVHEQQGMEVEQLYINPSVRNPRRPTSPCQPPSTPQSTSRGGPGRYSVPAKFQSPCRKRATFDHRHSPLADTSPIQNVERIPEEERGFKWLDTYPRNIFWNIKDQPPKMTTAQMRQAIREGNFPHGSRIPYSPPAPSTPIHCYSPRTPPSIRRLSPCTPPGFPPRSPLPQTRPIRPGAMDLPQGEPYAWLDPHPYRQQQELMVHADDLPESPLRQEIIRRYYPCPGSPRNQNR